MLKTNNFLTLFFSQTDASLAIAWTTGWITLFIIAVVILSSDRLLSREKFKVFKGTTVSHYQITVFTILLQLLITVWTAIHVGEATIFPNGSLINLTVGSWTSTIVIHTFLIIYLITIKGTMIRLESLLLFLTTATFAPFLINAGDFLTFFLSIEGLGFSFITILALPGLSFSEKFGIANDSKRRVLESALKYLLPTIFSSLLILVGIFVFYSFTLSINISDIINVVQSENLYNGPNKWWFSLATLLIICGFFFKLAIFPFHRWVFNIYSEQPIFNTIFLATVIKLIYFLAFVRVVVPLGEQLQWHAFLAIIGLISLFLGSMHGIYESRISVIIAASGLLNMGQIMLALSLGGIKGSSIAIFTMLVYTLLMLALGACIQAPEKAIFGYDQMPTLESFAKHRSGQPILTVITSVILFNLIGIPSLLGFYPKIYVFWGLLTILPSFAILFLVLVIISSFIYFNWFIKLITSPFSSSVALGLKYHIKQIFWAMLLWFTTSKIVAELLIAVSLLIACC